MNNNKQNLRQIINVIINGFTIKDEIYDSKIMTIYINYLWGTDISARLVGECLRKNRNFKQVKLGVWLKIK